MKKITSKILAPAAGLALCGLCLTSTLAVGGSDSPPDAASIVEALRAKGATRGVAAGGDTAALLNALKEKSTRGISISAEERNKLAVAVKDMPVQDMEIQFELNSAEISPKARPSIEALGKALQNAQLKGSSFMLAGHTDAFGSAPYNQQLSERRAEAVRNTLIEQYQLSKEKFITVGYGLERLKDRDNPYSGVNRRVEVVNIGE